MTQVSQIFNGDIQLENMSEDESDDEHRDDEIKKLLEEGLGNDAFDSDAEYSSQDISKTSSHANCSFVSNKEKEEDKSVPITECREGIFQTPKSNGNASGGFVKRVDFSDMPNVIPRPQELQQVLMQTLKNNNVFRAPGSSSSGGLHSILTNGVNGSGTADGGILKIEINGRGATSHSVSNKSNGGVPLNQKNREMEEIEVSSPTISLLHKEHCPRSGIGEQLWFNGENDLEQLRTMCESHRRQAQKANELAEALQKDKRALNHKIGLMKSEMIEMESRYKEKEKSEESKDADINRSKRRIQEAVAAYEKARINEVAAKEENAKLHLEIEQLQAEVRLLSQLGSSTQQAEVNDVVRQVNAKHEKERASWQTTICDLERQIKFYQRERIGVKENCRVKPSANAIIQTDAFNEEEDQFQNKHINDLEGGISGRISKRECHDFDLAFIQQVKQLPDREALKRIRTEYSIQRDKLVEFHKREFDNLRNRVGQISELYQGWQDFQECLSRDMPLSNEIKKLYVHSATNTPNAFIEPQKTVQCQADGMGEVMELTALVYYCQEEITNQRDLLQTMEEKYRAAEEEIKALNKKYKKLHRFATSCRTEWRKQEETLKAKNDQLTTHYLHTLKALNEKLDVVNQ